MSRLTKRDKYGKANPTKKVNHQDLIEKLAHYEDLEDQLEKLYGGKLSLDDVVNNLNRIVQNGEEKLDFARILTNSEAEKWDYWKDLEEQGKLMEVVYGFDKSDYPSAFECSVCGFSDWDTYTTDDGAYNYCPRCGAKMEGLKNE